MEANRTAYNAHHGIHVFGVNTIGHSLRGSSIDANVLLGIDLGSSSVTRNDPDDADDGPNGQLHLPVLAAAQPGLTTHVIGACQGQAHATLWIDLYASAVANPSGYGGGERSLGSLSITADASGDASFDVILAAATFTGEVLSATATDAAGNTREFSAVVVITHPPAAHAGGPYVVNEGASVVLTGAALFDPDGTIVAYLWDFDHNGVSFGVYAVGVAPTSRRLRWMARPRARRP